MIEFLQKGVTMLVSAITLHAANGYNMSNSMPVKSKDAIGDTSFNSLTPLAARKSMPQEKMSQMYDNISEWQIFCHDKILGGKLNIIA